MYKHQNFFYLFFIINIIFLSVISISLYRLLCRPDLDIFSTVSTDLAFLYNYYYSIGYSIAVGKVAFHSEMFFSESLFLVVRPSDCFKFTSFIGSSLASSWHFIHFLEDSVLHYSFFKFNEVIEVKFFTKINSFNYIEFFCLQDSIFLVSNDTTLVFFRIITLDSQEVSCIVIFLISPSSLMTSLTKLQCFCFDNLYISRKESIDLPVIFSVDFNLIPFTNKKLNLLFFYLLLEK